MTNAPNRDKPTKSEVSAAVLAMWKERTQEAREAVLLAYSPSVRAAARKAYEEARRELEPRPSLIPKKLPHAPQELDVPSYPAAGLDNPDVRQKWVDAHRAAAEARFRLQPAVLTAYADAQLECEKWDAWQRGRKPSGDLRHPVRRDRFERIVEEMRSNHDRQLTASAATIRAIETGDVVGVKFIGDEGEPWARIPILVLQSDLDRKAAEQRAKANRTPEQIAADDAKWDEMVAEFLADLPAKEQALAFPNLPELPAGRKPSAAEVAAWGYAIGKHLKYLERADQIEAKRKKDAATKVRTSAKREAERADPAGTAAAKESVKLRKAAERQRRWRERKMPSKDTGK